MNNSKSIWNEYALLRKKLKEASLTNHPCPATPTLPNYPYSEPFLLAVQFRRALTGFLFLFFCLLPIAGIILLWLSSWKAPTIFVFVYMLSSVVCWYVIVPRFNSSKEDVNRLYLSRYVLRHSKCKHWVHWDVAASGYDNQMYVDQFNNPPDYVLATINTDNVYPPKCSKCGVENDFDKILINNSDNWHY